MKIFSWINMIVIRWRGEWTVLGRNQAMKMLLEKAEMETSR